MPKDASKERRLGKQGRRQSDRVFISSTTIADKVKDILIEEDKILTGIEGKFVAACEKFKPTSIALFGSAVGKLKSGSDCETGF